VAIAWARAGLWEGAMLRVILSVGGWGLVCALIVFGTWWTEREREFFDNGVVRWKHLE